MITTRPCICLLILIFIMCSKDSEGQQAPVWSSFYENGFIWNPALTARWNFWELSATTRQEWSGFEGAPRYQTIGFQYPFIKRFTKNTLGAYLDQDQVGPYKATGVGLNYTYKIYPNIFGNRNGVLTFGLSGRINQMRFDPSGLVGFDGLDQETGFTLNDRTFLKPNANFGVFYNSVKDFYSFEEHYYFGISLNNLIPNSNEFSQILAWQFVPHINIHGGMRIKGSIRSDSYFEPSIMISMASTKAINVMGHIRYEKEQKYWGAVGLVSNGEFFVQAGVIFNDQSVLGWLVNDGILRLGTKVDYFINPLRQFSGFGYEAYISYAFSEESF